MDGRKPARGSNESDKNYSNSVSVADEENKDSLHWPTYTVYGSKDDVT